MVQMNNVLTFPFFTILAFAIHIASLVMLFQKCDTQSLMQLTLRLIKVLKITFIIRHMPTFGSSTLYVIYFYTINIAIFIVITCNSFFLITNNSITSEVMNQFS